MWSPAKLPDGRSSGYGLGWFVDKVSGHRDVHHAAGAPGTATIISPSPADRGFTLTKAEGGAVSGMILRLGQDRMTVSRIGALFRTLEPEADPAPELTRRVEAVLKAFALGGKSVEEVVGVTPQARKDYAR